MLISITERMADVRHDVGAAMAPACVSLSPADHGCLFAYARVVSAAPVARWEGVAVVLGDSATAPDPVQIRIRDGKGKGPACTLEIRRKALPVLVSVDRVAGTARVVRRIGPDEVPDPVVAEPDPAPAIDPDPES